MPEVEFIHVTWRRRMVGAETYIYVFFVYFCEKSRPQNKNKIEAALPLIVTAVFGTQADRFPANSALQG